MSQPEFAPSISREADAIMISLTMDDLVVEDCSSVLVIPDKAVQEPGYIKGLSSSAGGSAKHEFHALAQMAYFQYQDDELEIVVTDSPCQISDGQETEVLHSGMVIVRDSNGMIHAVAHRDINQKKLLESANRYCTRWVRLDI